MWCRIAAFLCWFTLLCYCIEDSSSSTVYYTFFCSWIPISTLGTSSATWIDLTIIWLVFWAELTYFADVIPYRLIGRAETLSNSRSSNNSRIRLLAITRILVINIRFPTNFSALINCLVVDQILRADAHFFPKTKIGTSRAIKTLQSQWINVRLR